MGRNKKTYAFSLSKDIGQKLSAFLLEAAENPRLLGLLNLKVLVTKSAAPEVDDVGLTKGDYDELRAFAGCAKDGKDLVSYALLHPALKSTARKMVSKAQARNAQAKRRAEAPSRRAGINISNVVEALILSGLEKVRNASVEPAGRKSRDARKAA